MSPMPCLRSPACCRSLALELRRLSFHESPAPSGRRLFGTTSPAWSSSPSTLIVYRLSEGIYRLCTTAADYSISTELRKKGGVKETDEGEEVGTSSGGEWHSELGLLPSFSTWSQVTMLHMYLLQARLRCLPPEQMRVWHRLISDHHFHNCERIMEQRHNMSSAALRQRYLKDLFEQWRGAVMAYDEGLVRGDAFLAAAVWRNLFRGRPDVDARSLAGVVAWIRASLVDMTRLDDSDMMIARGETRVFRRSLKLELSKVKGAIQAAAGEVG